MPAHTGDTIAAPITGPCPSAVCVIRLSGPEVPTLIARLCKRSAQVLSQPRYACYTPILDVALTPSPTLDYALATFFPAPDSFTGEDVLEVALHGGTYLVRRFLSALRTLGVRAARPGEFSERAFLNGKVDLSQAEAIADLIHAETEFQARAAREQLEGKLRGVVDELGSPIRDLVAEIEAYIDFPEEGIELPTLTAWKQRLGHILSRADSYLSSYSSGRLYREGAKVSLIGIPNAGKSSLLNTLLGEDRAIVTELPGTTRDTIEEHFSLDGLLVRLVDTAGIELATSAEHSRPLSLPEQQGIERSWAALRSSDAVLFVFDPSQDAAVQMSLFEQVRRENSRILLVESKADISFPDSARAAFSHLSPWRVSAVSGAGVDEMRAGLSEFLVGARGQEDRILISTERHFECLSRARENLEEAANLIESYPPEMLAFALRSALGELSDIIGVTHTEDLLGLIFSRFCIGK